MKTKPAYYAIIPATVRYDKKLSSSEKIFYGEITALTSKTGDCWASNSYFSDLYNVSPSTISAWVGKLKKAGYIKVRHQMKGKQITQRIISIVGGQNIQTGGQKIDTGVVRKSEGGGQNILGGWSENLQENNINSNNIKENIIKTNNTDAGWNKDLIENKILDILMNYDIHPEDSRYITALDYYKEAGTFEGIADKMNWDLAQRRNWWKVLGRIENN